MELDFQKISFEVYCCQLCGIWGLIGLIISQNIQNFRHPTLTSNFEIVLMEPFIQLCYFNETFKGDFKTKCSKVRKLI